MMTKKKLLGGYHVMKTIGQGAFSKVKMGIHKETGQKVAIKIIDKKQMAIKAAKAKKAAEEREKKKKAEEARKAAAAAAANGVAAHHPNPLKTQRPHSSSSTASKDSTAPQPGAQSNVGPTSAMNPPASYQPHSETATTHSQAASASPADVLSNPTDTISAKPRDPRGELVSDSEVPKVPPVKEKEGVTHVRSGSAKVEGAGSGDMIPSAKVTEGGGGLKSASEKEAAPSFVSSLQLEVQLLMRLDHPNIISLYQVMETEDECYVIMEYASGGELIEYIAARNYLTEKEARKFFRQIVSAMDHCHLANVVHRDLKLENLLLNDDRNILISDFGLGRTFNPDAEEYMKTFCGTPNYAAVELISGIPYNGVKSDIWAMGVVLYVMMTGKPPFSGENISALYSKIKNVDYKCPDYFSKDLRNLLGKMLRKDPKSRIDMDGLRNDPWMNFEEIERPLRIIPKVTGSNPTASQVSQFIQSITSDSSCVVYTIRQHMRDGASVSGASPDKNKTLQRAVVARRKSISVTSSLEGGGPNMFASKRPGFQAPSGIPEAGGKAGDVEDNLSPLPLKPSGSTFGVQGNLSKPQHRRRMSMQESRGPRNILKPSGSTESPNGFMGPSQNPTGSSTLSNATSGSGSMLSPNQSSPLSPEPSHNFRARRNTIQLAFQKFTGGVSNNSTENFGGRSSETSYSGVTSTDASSHMVGASRSNCASPIPGGVGSSGLSQMRQRRASISSSIGGGDRESSLMRRMSMVSPVDLGPLGSPSLQIKTNGTVVSPAGVQIATTPSPTDSKFGKSPLSESVKLGSPSSKSPSITMSVDEDDEEEEQQDGESPLNITPSKKEIEDWHLMHRPPKEIRSARYSFNTHTTSSLSPSAIFQEVHRVLLMLKKSYADEKFLYFERDPDFYQLNCKLKSTATSPGSGGEEEVVFEIEVCKIWLLKLHGVRIKRLAGSAFVFKDVYSKIVENLAI
ncbi:Map microtubule affinity-regulating kinase [Chytridiales sp. JEL 0842]|nr:Map microtubule affinity-regulating kinase [Chytridiales sp. JEL 0842]